MIRLEHVLALAGAVTVSARSYIQYSTVPGYFLQDDNSTNATTFDYTATNFGLINQSYPTDPSNAASLSQWQRFAIVVASLKSKCAKNIDYKLIFMGRHGEGYHNAAETYYGTPAWNCYWSLLEGNGTVIWADPELTEDGIEQAEIANQFWLTRITDQRITPPQTFYSSPMTRCLATADLTFVDLPLPRKYPYQPIIKSKLREGISEHTCDRRSNRTYIEENFPNFRFEPGFPEFDALWTGVTAETRGAQDFRSKQLLDDIFTHDKSTYTSFTSHSGEIASLLRVVGHRVFSLRTGAIIPVLVKAETVELEDATSTISSATWTPSPHCTEPPVTSVSGGPSGGCVCPSSAAPIVSLLPPFPTST